MLVHVYILYFVLYIFIFLRIYNIHDICMPLLYGVCAHDKVSKEKYGVQNVYRAREIPCTKCAQCTGNMYNTLFACIGNTVYKMSPVHGKHCMKYPHCWRNNLFKVYIVKKKCHVLIVA